MNITQAIEHYKDQNLKADAERAEEEAKKKKQTEDRVVKVMEESGMIYDRIEGSSVWMPHNDRQIEVHLNMWKYNNAGFRIHACDCPECGRPVWSRESALSAYNIGMIFSEPMDKSNSHLDWYEHNYECGYPFVEKKAKPEPDPQEQPVNKLSDLLIISLQNYIDERAGQILSRHVSDYHERDI